MSMESVEEAKKKQKNTVEEKNESCRPVGG
jgi:hypothetical protein